MKTETRKVTIEQTVYIADDGREFMSEDACTDYEFELLEKTFNCYDGTYNKSKPEDCTYIDLPTAEDVERFKQYCDIMDLIDDGLDTPGLYMFDNRYYAKEHWLNLDEVIVCIRGEKTEVTDDAESNI